MWYEHVMFSNSKVCGIEKMVWNIFTSTTMMNTSPWFCSSDESWKHQNCCDCLFVTLPSYRVCEVVMSSETSGGLIVKPIILSPKQPPRKQPLPSVKLEASPTAPSHRLIQTWLWRVQRRRRGGWAGLRHAHREWAPVFSRLPAKLHSWLHSMQQDIRLAASRWHRFRSLLVRQEQCWLHRNQQLPKWGSWIWWQTGILWNALRQKCSSSSGSNWQPHANTSTAFVVPGSQVAH